MNRKRVMIAAPKSGSGKTLLVCALLQTLKEDGLRTVSFKCGPDYIDPMFHERVLGVPSKNLDTFFTGEEGTRALFRESARDEDFAVLEGVMGLYDGLGGVREEGSSYHLARVTKTPVVLVVDARGMGRSVVPLIAGFLDYDEAHLIKGVILNRVSGAYYETVKPLIEEELKVRAAGFFPERKELCVESRHLGLVMPGELADIRARIQTAAGILRETVSLDSLMEIAGSAGEPGTAGRQGKRKEHAGGERPVIAVARDEAFCFYYADNLRMLEEMGARLAYFSPLRDEGLPEGCHGLLLGGGYPELYAGTLSKNSRMRRAVREAAAGGMPVVAECGGFMYLHAALTNREGSSHEMAGVIPATCFYAGKLVRFGYIELYEKQSRFLPEGARIRGHEFHYYDSTDNGEDAVALKPVTGREYSCMIERENLFAGFPHLYYPSNPAFAANFVEKAVRYQGGAGQGRR